MRKSDSITKHLLGTLILSICILPFSIQAQSGSKAHEKKGSDHQNSDTIIIIHPSTNSGNKIEETFIVVEEMPEFPGGSKAMMQFLKDNITYPKQAVKDSVQGTVYINFIVEADGRISHARVLRGIGTECDKEALRVVNLMPAWKPGKQRGKNVRVGYNLPIKFKL